MLFWQIFAILGIAFLVLELFAPLLFFLNFGIGGLITAFVAIFFPSLDVLIPVFIVVSITLLLAFRPFLTKAVDLRNGKTLQTGIEGKYIGAIAKVIEPINEFSGAITIYGERWEARAKKGKEFSVDSEVKIIKSESLVMFVEEINE